MFADGFNPPVATAVDNRQPPTAGKERETGLTAEVTEVRGGLGVGRLARLWKFSDLRASA